MGYICGPLYQQNIFNATARQTIGHAAAYRTATDNNEFGIGDRSHDDLVFNRAMYHRTNASTLYSLKEEYGPGIYA